MVDENQNGNGKAEPEAKKPTCFVVSPIGAAGSPERKHANVTLRFIIEPVLERCGFEKARRADTLGEPGIISRQIISELLNADLVIADLTGHNPNVFYELAIRHGTGRPFVQLLSKGQTLPFDVLQQRTIFFDRTDLEDVEDCKAELERQVRAVMVPGFKMETPIGQTLDYERLRGGGEIGQALAKLTDEVSSFKRDVRISHDSYASFPVPGLGADREAEIVETVVDRSQKYLDEHKYGGLLPARVLSEIIADLSTRERLSGRRIDLRETDVVVRAVIDHRLLIPAGVRPS